MKHIPHELTVCCNVRFLDVVVKITLGQIKCLKEGTVPLIWTSRCIVQFKYPSSETTKATWYVDIGTDVLKRSTTQPSWPSLRNITIYLIIFWYFLYIIFIGLYIFVCFILKTLSFTWILTSAWCLKGACLIWQTCVSPALCGYRRWPSAPARRSKGRLAARRLAEGECLRLRCWLKAQCIDKSCHEICCTYQCMTERTIAILCFTTVLPFYIYGPKRVKLTW